MSPVRAVHALTHAHVALAHDVGELVVCRRRWPARVRYLFRATGHADWAELTREQVLALGRADAVTDGPTEEAP